VFLDPGPIKPVSGCSRCGLHGLGGSNTDGIFLLFSIYIFFLLLTFLVSSFNNKGEMTLLSLFPAEMHQPAQDKAGVAASMVTSQ